MHKKWLMLTAVAAASCAHAQSSVNLFGVVDIGVGHFSVSGTSNDSSITKMVSSGLSSNQFGFRGIEDLGGGMHAAFWLEAGMNAHTGGGQDTNVNNQTTGATGGGGLTFNRRSTVDIGGGFGALRLGRDYTPDFWSKTVFDPFGTLGAGAANISSRGTGPTAFRASNGISYLYGIAPNQGSHGLGSKGFYLQATYAMGGNASNVAAPIDKNDGNYAGIRVGFASDVLNAALGYGKTKRAAVQDYSVWNVGASYDLKVAKISALFNQNKTGDGAANYKTYLIGASMPAGEAGLIRASYSRLTSNGSFDNGGKSDKFAIGYVHSLSKRTSVYATYGYIRSNNSMYSLVLPEAPAAALTDTGGRSSGFDVGLKHSF